MKQFSDKYKNSTNHNTRVLTRYALNKTHKRYQTRLNKRYQHEIDKKALEDLKLTQTVDRTKGETASVRRKIDAQNEVIKRLNRNILQAMTNTITHKIAISNTHILDKLYNESSINSDIIKSKQIEDAQLYAVIEFLKTSNTTLLFTVNDNFQKTMFQGRYKNSERDG